ncbi:MAG: HDIG domain-containing protein [Lachnospiraceae bacterium]|nr:HDIG domain-containing protein [Lachnospiraceae bacterium]
MEEVLDNRNKIMDYAWHAALYHDIGKLYVLDTIAMYGRRLLDSEYVLLRSHPDKGAELASRFDTTKDYADVIRGHHIWYDGSHGYPEDFDVLHSPYKAIIDIVSVADCLDAATDGVGRSYRQGRTLEEFQEELKKGAGTRYAPYVAQPFDDPATYQDISYLLKNGRKKLYDETYFLLKDLLKK